LAGAAWWSNGSCGGRCGERWWTACATIRALFEPALRITSLYLHFGPFARRVVAELDDRIEEAADDVAYVSRA
jgi:hypothetical protein